MAHRKSTKIHSWLCFETSGRFLMLPPELYEAPAFQSLNSAERDFYIFLNTYRETEQQRACLYETLTAYNKYLDLGLTDFDINQECRPNKGTKYNSGFFVCPKSHLEEYGYNENTVKPLKRKLRDKGFIKIAYQGLGAVLGFQNNITVYQFITEWQKK